MLNSEQCIYCGEEKDAPLRTLACSARCCMVAHEDCYRRRRSFPSWKKKHARESNGGHEFCPAPTCQGRLKARRGRPSPHKDEQAELTSRMHSLSLNVRAAQEEQETVDETTCCKFFMKNGRRCKRAAVELGACRLHAQEARVKSLMLACLEEDGLDTDRGVQCTLTTKDEDDDDKDVKIRALQEALLLLQTRFAHECAARDAKYDTVLERLLALERRACEE